MRAQLPNRLRKSGNFSDIRAPLEAERAPNDPMVLTKLGLAHLHAGRAQAALEPLLRAMRLAPNEVAHHYNLALALELVGREAEAITGFRRALALDPKHPDALERLAGLLMASGSRAEAIGCFRRAAEASPDTLRGALDRAEVSFEEGQSADAEALLRATITQYPESAEAKRFLAVILREQGRFTEAIPLLEVATAGSATEAAKAYADLAASKQVTTADRPMLAQMEKLACLEPLPARHRALVHFALGKCYDDLGRYAEAMQHFDRANDIAGHRIVFDRAHLGASVNRLIESFPRESVAAPETPGSTSERPVLIVGMPRSGTSLVEQILSAHPAVAGGGELLFWHEQAKSPGVRAGESAADEARRLAADYEATLAEIDPGAPRVTDKMPGNFLWIGLFHRVFPRARIIHCRRHPVDVCLSNYFIKFTPPMSFTYRKADLAFYYRAYQRLMVHWRDVLPAETFLEVDYEALVTAPEPTIRRMVTFLGLPWDDACLHPEANGRAVKTASMWQVRQPIYRSAVERWRHYEPWLGELGQLLRSRPPPPPERPRALIATLQQAADKRAKGEIAAAVHLVVEAAQTNPYDALLENETGLIHLARHAWREAVVSFERAIALEPTLAIAHYNLGAAHERCRAPDAAITAYQRAIDASPGLAEAHNRLGNLLHAQGREQEAHVCFLRTAEAAEGTALGRLSLAKARMIAGNVPGAEALLREIVAAEPGTSAAWRLLGNVLAERGDFGEACGAFEQAIARDPEQVAAYYDLVQARRIGESDLLLVRRIEARLSEPGANDFDRTLLHFALGKCWDDLGEPAKAIRHFDAGNSLEHAGLSFDRAAFAAGVDRIIAGFSADQPAVPTAPRSEAPLLIIGMPRSGTTLVEQILSSHPAVAGGGELRFWTERANAACAPDPSELSSLAEAYLGILHAIDPSAARVTDKNPFNFLWLGLIHRVLPNARFIHCRRNALDTALSIYLTRFGTRQDFAYDRGDIAFFYREYERIVAHWRAALPSERLLEISYEDLVRDPEPAVRRMVAFLGLPWDDACLHPEANRRAVKTASQWQARQPVHTGSIGRWRRYAPWLGELQLLGNGTESCAQR